MGTDIFQFLSVFPFHITMVCKSAEGIEKIKKAWLRKLNRSLLLGLINEAALNEKAKLVKFSNDLNDLSETDLVIESITEDQKLKSVLFKELDKILPPETILTTNTSSIPLLKLVPSVSRQPVFLGLHFFYPVTLKNLVEINTTGYVKQDSLNSVKGLLNNTGRFFITLPEENHFLVNRLFLKLQAGTYNIHKEENIPFEILDQWISEKIFHTGVFRFFDQVGNDIMYTSVKNYTENYPDRNFYVPLLAGLKEKADQNLLGIKSGKGFYDYSGKTASQDHPALADLPAGKKSEIVQKLLKYFFEPIEKAVLQNLCSIGEMEHIVREYTGNEISPFDLAKEAGFEDF